MSQVLKDALYHNVAFYVLTGIAIALIITSFFIPPTGVIDGSVLAATGEIFAFAGLGTVIKAIDKGVDASVTHKDTTINISNE